VPSYRDSERARTLAEPTNNSRSHIDPPDAGDDDDDVDVPSFMRR
jgi:cell division protein FtsZ